MIGHLSSGTAQNCVPVIVVSACCGYKGK